MPTTRKAPWIFFSGTGGVALIELRGVHKKFGQLEVLKGIDLHVAKGEKLVIIGPSGSGKSTLIRCMNGL